MPAVLSTLKPFAVRLVPRVLLVAKRKRHTLAVAPPTHIGTESVASATSTPMPSSNSCSIVRKALRYVEAHTTGGDGYVAQSRGERKAMAKDVLLLSLEALAQSADAFPPLKSAVGGLLFLTTQIELVSSNKEQISKIYAQIDAFAASLVRAIPDATALSPAHEAAIRALAEDIQAVSLDIEAIARQRPVKHLFCAKRHSGQLVQLMKRLDQADKSFTRTLLSTVESKVSEIHESVLPLRDEVHRLARIGKYFFLTYLRRYSNDGEATDQPLY
ncbi:unnamed protein product [Peniophora sp. CBMAI 1063]|nr:unnamed protein product [Peniophora sp. CBMAI 1063]